MSNPLDTMGFNRHMARPSAEINRLAKLGTITFHGVTDLHIIDTISLLFRRYK